MFRPIIHSIHMQGESEKRDAMEGGVLALRRAARKIGAG